MSKVLMIGGGAVIGLIVVAGGMLLLSDKEEDTAGPAGIDQVKKTVSDVVPKLAEPAQKQVATNKTVDFGDIAGAHAAFDFTAAVPPDWEIEVVPGIEAINIFEPSAADIANLEKSQIFLRHFEASDFLTLSTVTIHEQTNTTINGHEVVVYDITKKPGVANFSGQPTWRSGRHMVTDIRVKPTGSTEFIVIGKRPELSQQIFDDFVQSIRFSGESLGSELVPPVAGFVNAVTLKPFGINITPATSSVQPERFTGFHTGADAELPAQTPVVAIADGLVLRSGTADGYGGIVAIEHELDSQRVVGIYGHLDPKSLVKSGARVMQGEQIAVLGEAFSTETDGERAHLHFGLSKATGTDVRGYVASYSDLALWIDPLGLY